MRQGDACEYKMTGRVGYVRMALPNPEAPPPAHRCAGSVSAHSNSHRLAGLNSWEGNPTDCWERDFGFSPGVSCRTRSALSTGRPPLKGEMRPHHDVQCRPIISHEQSGWSNRALKTALPTSRPQEGFDQRAGVFYLESVCRHRIAWRVYGACQSQGIHRRRSCRRGFETRIAFSTAR
jgi:hypothetical protein